MNYTKTKLTDSEKISIIQDIVNDNFVAIIGFEKFPQVGDKFTLEDVTFVAQEKQYKIKVI